jgi:septal ring factor EnvC (AmiA/AmiB activator)
MYYKNFLTILASLLILTGCLQNPAPIDGINNYYTNSSKYKKQQYRQIEPECSDNQVFADEQMTKNKVFDPYQLPPVENLIENENPVIEQNSSKDLKIDEEKSDLDWDNIFSEVKNQKIETSQSTQSAKSAPKKEIKKNENNETLKKPGAKIIESNKTPLKKTSAVTSAAPTANSNAVKKDETKPQQVLISKPTNGKILTKYGQSQNSELDDGMTFAVSDKMIKSAGDGKVIYVDGESSSHKTVIVKHNNGIISSYSYNGDIKTSINKEIKAGQAIGEVDFENNVLYFTVRQNGKTIDPEKIMK